jgi:hypothetical protein
VQRYTWPCKQREGLRKLSQNNITTDNTKKRNASTVKQCPAPFSTSFVTKQHHNKPHKRRVGGSTLQDSDPSALNSLLRPALKKEKQRETHEKMNRRLTNMHKRKIKGQGNARNSKREQNPSSDRKGRA